MPTAPNTYAELFALTDSEVLELAKTSEHDQSRALPSDVFVVELSRRENRRSTDAMLEATRNVERLTWVIAGMTFVSTVFVILSALGVVGS